MSQHQLEMETQILIEMKGSRLFNSLTPEVLKAMAHYAVVKNYKKGEKIWKKGEPGNFCAVIADGLIDIRRSNEEGETRIIGIFGPHEVVGLSALIAKKNYPGDATVCSKNARVIKFYLRTLEQELTPQVFQEVFNWKREMLIAHEQILREKIDIVGAGLLDSRLKCLMNHLCERFGERESNGQVRINLPITKTQMAHLVEIRIETVIKALNKWEKAGLMKMDAQGISILSPREICRKS